MPLSTGDKLGPYQILTPLGVGGMGEVYPANQGIPVYEYDVTADGKRFLVDTNTAPASAPPWNVVVNWNAGLNN